MKPTQELIKTGVYVGVAAALAAAGYFATAAPTYQVTNQIVGTNFYDFDSAKVTQLRIVGYNAANSEVIPFEVLKQGDVWVLPQHEGYPADAVKRLGEALAQIQGLQRGPLVTEDPLQFDTMGVVSPENIKPGTPGSAVGTLVMAKAGSETKAAIVIGNADKDNSELRYIRRSDEDRVYRAKIDMSKLTTKFEEWIQTDLLEVGAVSLKEVDFVDLSVDERRGRIQQKGIFRVDYDQNKPAEQRWTLLHAVEPKEDAPEQKLAWEPVNLAAEQKELDTAKLDAMQRAFNDLKIVGVRRKPELISRIMAGELTELNPQEQQQFQLDAQDMVQKGFFLSQNGVAPLEGLVEVGLEDGVKYSLKFGRFAGQDDASDKDPSDPAAGKGKFRRYMFIEANFDKSLIAEPEYEVYTPRTPAPATIPATPAPPAAPTGETPAAPATPATETPAAPADGKPAPEAPKEEAKPAAEAPKGDEPKSEEPKAEESKSESSDAASSDACQDAPAETPAAPTAQPAPAAPAAAEGTGAAPAAPVDPDRARVDAANAAKKADYEKTLADGEKRAKELNSRFASWYYVISSDVYDKVYMKEAQVTKFLPGAGPEAESPEAFRDLKAPLDQEPGAAQ